MLLFAYHLLPPVLCHLLCVTCSLSPVLCHLFSVTCSVSPVLCHLFCVTCSVSPVLCHLFCVTCSVSLALCHLFCVTCSVSPVLCHLFCVTCSVSPALCHLFCVTCSVSLALCHWLSPALCHSFSTKPKEHLPGGDIWPSTSCLIRYRSWGMTSLYPSTAVWGRVPTPTSTPGLVLRAPCLLCTRTLRITCCVKWKAGSWWSSALQTWRTVCMWMDLQKFPLAAKVSFTESVLHPGEMLFIPAKYWHHVRSLDLSFSVSFWWSWQLSNVLFSCKHCFFL